MLASIGEVLEEIGSEKLFATNDFLVVRKLDVYVGASRLRRQIYFLRFLRPPETSSEIGKLPELLPWSKLSLVKNIMKLPQILKRVDDVPVMRLTGSFKVPIGAHQVGDNRYSLKYLQGYGVMYALAVRVIGSRVAILSRTKLEALTGDKVLRMIERLSDEAKGA